MNTHRRTHGLGLELHAAIREARKAYQADGTMPDWEALARAGEAVRASVTD